jgi:hypothetical protein
MHQPDISNNVAPAKPFLRAVLHSLRRVVLFVFFDLCLDDQSMQGASSEMFFLSPMKSNSPGFRQPFWLVKRCPISVLVIFSKSVNSRMLYH